jgi:signal transduction histidine kinase
MASVSSFPPSVATRDDRRRRALHFFRSRTLEWGDPASAAEALVAYCGAEFPRARASVLRLDPVTGLPEFVAGSRGDAGPYLEEGSDGLREVMFAQAIRTGAPQRRGAASPQPQGSIPHRLPVRSEVVVPVVTPRSVWGLIHLEHPDSGAFSAEMEESVEIVAAQVAVFLDSVSAKDSGARREDRLRCRLREMPAEIFGARLASYAAIALHNAGLHQRLASKAAELQRSNAELKASQDQLVVSEKMAALGRVTAGVAHEINSPLGDALNALRLIRSYAEEYGYSLDDPEVGVDDHREIARDILTALSLAEAGVTKATRFVRRIEAQTRTGEERQLVFSAAEEVEATVRLLELELMERGITLITEVDPAAALLGDPGRFALVVQNLVSNAADSYEDRPGAVYIRLRSEEERVVLEVEDRGSGIPEELRGRVFDYLFTTKEMGRGTGLGLSIVHSVVTTHFLGEVGFTSRPGEGTVFTVHIPRCPASGD